MRSFLVLIMDRCAYQDIREEGRQAYINRVDIRDCPYQSPNDSNKHSEWMVGYLQASSDGVNRVGR